MAGLLADCHVHFEGTLPEEALQRLAARAGHAFANLDVFRERCRGMGDGAGFLSLYADVCRLFRRPEDYGEAARDWRRAAPAATLLEAMKRLQHDRSRRRPVPA